MKFTYSWLKEHLETKLDVYHIADILTNIGLEVEGIEDKKKKFEPFRVALIKKAEKQKLRRKNQKEKGAGSPKRKTKKEKGAKSQPKENHKDKKA